jgi:polysaccharide export outer membrane protein
MKNSSLVSFLAFLLLATTVFSQQQQQAAAEKAGQTLTGRIAAADTVRISVFREDILDTAGQLGEAGKISMPLIGEIKMQGLTTSAAEQLIEGKLRGDYLVNPQVSVRITNRVIKTVSVNGEVRNPGVFTLPVDRKLRFSEVIAMAGGVTDIANEKKVTLKRIGRKAIVTINFRTILNGKSNDFILQSGDVINVPEGWF